MEATVEKDLVFATHGGSDLTLDIYRASQDDAPVTPYVPACAEFDVGVLNAAIFNSGILAQRHPDAGARFEYAAASREVLERARTLDQICEVHGTSLPTAALAFAAAPPP